MKTASKTQASDRVPIPPNPAIRRRRWANTFASALLAAALACPAANAEDEDIPNGELTPTQKQIDWANANLIKVGAVHLNALGLQRVNSHRAALRQPALTTAPVPVGLEVIPQSRLFSTAAHAASTNSLPRAVDNSTLPCFPPIGHQGGIGSCVAWATTYYMGTHMLGLARGLNSTDPADLSTKLSPKWTYNMINDGVDEGSHTEDALELLLKNGAPTWADFPYSGSADEPRNYLEWSGDPAVWRAAIRNRFASSGEVTDLDTATGRNNLKTLLSNGYVCVYSTYPSGWQYVTIGDDPSTTTDDAIAGQRACAFVKDRNYGHKMTVVGYNDDVWVDLNGNGRVDSGEKGAFRVANSYGTGWQDHGFGWVCYDALRESSAVSDADNTDRVAGWKQRAAQYITARDFYNPSLLGEFRLQTADRSQLSVKVGRSTMSSTTPSTVVASGAFLNQGGHHGLITGADAAESGSFVLDLTDIVQTDPRRYYLQVTDGAAGKPVTLRGFKLTKEDGRPLGICPAGVLGIVGFADNRTIRAFTHIGNNPADDVGNTLGTAKTVAAPGGVEGRLEIISDADVYRFNLTEASNVTLRTSGDVDTLGTLCSSAGAQIAQNDDANGSSNFRINATLQPGVYYITVKSCNAFHAGAYRLDIGATPLPAPRMSVIGQSALLSAVIKDGATLPTPVTGTIFANISASGAVSTRSYMIRSTGTAPLELNGSPLVKLSGAGSSSFRVTAQPVNTISPGNSTSFRIEYAPTAPGTHVAKVSISSNDARTSPYEFVIRGTASFPRDDHGSGFESATKVGVPARLAANINGGPDVDCFKFTLLSARSVTIRTTGTMDTSGALFNASGALLAANDDASSSDRNFKISAQLPAGTYFVKVRGQSQSVVGNYTIRID